MSLSDPGNPKKPNQHLTRWDQGSGPSPETFGNADPAILGAGVLKAQQDFVRELPAALLLPQVGPNCFHLTVLQVDVGLVGAGGEGVDGTPAEAHSL